MSRKSTVCVVVRNEGPYLAEWIAHYTALGFDRIVVYDNNSTDNSASILRRLDRAGVVVHRPWPARDAESPQISGYTDGCNRCDTEWIFLADADELLVLHRHDTVNAFLARFDDRPDVTGIGVNWRLFGDSGLTTRDDRPMSERFTFAETGPNDHLKSFSRLSALGNNINMHACRTLGRTVHPSGAPLTMTDWGRSADTEYTVAQVNHYYTKTYEEYQSKRARGRGAVNDGHWSKYAWHHDDAFRNHNRNEVQDLSIRRHRPAFDRAHARVRRLIAREPGPIVSLARRLGGR